MARTAAVLRFPANAQRNKRAMEVNIGDTEVRMLKQLVEYEGLKEMARILGISESAVLRVCSGWFNRCNTPTQQKVRAFFAEQPLT